MPAFYHPMVLNDQAVQNFLKQKNRNAGNDNATETIGFLGMIATCLKNMPIPKFPKGHGKFTMLFIKG